MPYALDRRDDGAANPARLDAPPVPGKETQLDRYASQVVTAAPSPQPSPSASPSGPATGAPLAAITDLEALAPTAASAPSFAEAEAWNRSHVRNVVRFDHATYGNFAKINGELDAARVAHWQQEHGLAGTGKVDDETCDVAEGKPRAPAPEPQPEPQPNPQPQPSPQPQPQPNPQPNPQPQPPPDPQPLRKVDWMRYQLELSLAMAVLQQHPPDLARALELTHLLYARLMHELDVARDRGPLAERVERAADFVERGVTMLRGRLGSDPEVAHQADLVWELAQLECRDLTVGPLDLQEPWKAPDGHPYDTDPQPLGTLYVADVGLPLRDGRDELKKAPPDLRAAHDRAHRVAGRIEDNLPLAVYKHPDIKRKWQRISDLARTGTSALAAHFESPQNVAISVTGLWEVAWMELLTVQRDLLPR